MARTTLRDTPNHPVWRAAAYGLPLIGLLAIVVSTLALAGVGPQRMGAVEAALYLAGGLFCLTFAGTRLSSRLEIDEDARALVVTTRYPYRGARTRTVGFDALREVRVIRGAWLSALLRVDGGRAVPLTPMVPRDRAGEAAVAEAIAAVRTATGRPLPEV